MNATDVYVEQLIIGGIVVAIVLVLFTGSLPEPGTNAVSIAVYGAIAYLAGLLYDRIGDTLLERIEKRQRLEFAIKEKEKRRDFDDPFPEGDYRMSVYKHGEELARQYNYLRTRLRLARAVASLLPAATVAVLVRRYGGAGWEITLGVIAVYAIVPLINPFWGELPKTYDKTKLEKYAKCEERWLSAYAPAIAGLFGIVLATLMLPIEHAPWALAIIAAGIAATLLAGWVWIRILGTFHAFLRDANPTGPAPRGYSGTSPQSPVRTR